MMGIVGKYTFWLKNGQKTITCTLGYAMWLSGEGGRTRGGVFWSDPLKVYL